MAKIGYTRVSTTEQNTDRKDLIRNGRWSTGLALRIAGKPANF
jgi:DNA invertase Pin-like site-specific DNA recombinase